MGNKTPKNETAAIASEVNHRIAFAVEDNVPVPAKARKEGGSKYPFGAMQVGQSFFAPGVKVQTVRGMAYRYGKDHGMDFLVREENDGARCWRIKSEPAPAAQA